MTGGRMHAAARSAPVALTLLGLLVSGYLFGRTLTLLMSQDPDAFDVCSAVFGTGCDKTLVSDTSWVLGIPLAGWGLVYYGALLMLFLMARALGDEFAPQSLTAALLVSVAGVAGSLVLATLLLGGWAPFCPLCMVVHVINPFLAVALKVRLGSTWAGVANALASALRPLFRKSGGRPPQWRWQATGLLTAALTALALYEGLFILSERWLCESRDVFSPHRLLAAYASAPEIELPASPDKPQRGPEHAPVEMVVFSSFHCPACRQFSREMRVLMDSYPDAVSLVFRHFPLDGACNPSVVNEAGESGACETACAAVAAQRQGKFWEFHDTLFKTHFPPTPDALEAIAAEIGLDLARFNAERASEEVRTAVRQDIEQGIQLQVQSIPTIFMNRRSLPGIGARSIEIIIKDTLKNGATRHGTG
ncbi:MAG: thioredoxin domain-containing protein [Candidatus Hydrogenedentales bacterium]|jgi:protein-disulfide isomerase/uncharacterized membrane protein